MRTLSEAALVDKFERWAEVRLERLNSPEKAGIRTHLKMQLFGAGIFVQSIVESAELFERVDQIVNRMNAAPERK